MISLHSFLCLTSRQNPKCCIVISVTSGVAVNELWRWIMARKCCAEYYDVTLTSELFEIKFHNVILLSYWTSIHSGHLLRLDGRTTWKHNVSGLDFCRCGGLIYQYYEHFDITWYELMYLFILARCILRNKDYFTQIFSVNNWKRKQGGP